MSSEENLQELVDKARAGVEKNPDSARAHVRFGMALQRAGRVGEAEAALRKSVELEPNMYEAWINLGGVLFARWDFKGSIEANLRAVSCKPNDVLGHYNLGLGYLYEGKANDVVACFQRVIQIDPEHGGGHYHLAAGLNAVGDAQTAETHLDRAAALGYSPSPDLIKAIEKSLKRDSDGGDVPSIEIGQDPSDH